MTYATFAEQVATITSQGPAETSSNTGEQVLFWIVAPLAVLGALGLVSSRKAVHGALFLALTMISLAVFYIAQEAPFLGVVQIVVYTGAIMMLFLFVIMLVGVDASDSRVETIRGQRAAALLAVIGVVILLMAVAGQSALPGDPVGMAEAAPDGNVVGIADLLFSRYVVAFEALGALLITAAVGAMALTHRERVFARPSQRSLSEKRFSQGRPEDAAGLPAPGVYARHNAVDTPALLPDGTPSEDSVSRVLVARGDARPAEEFTADVLTVAEGGEAPSEARGAASEQSEGRAERMSATSQPGETSGDETEEGEHS